MSNVNSDGNAPFSKWRAIFFPIRAFELKKVLPMGAIFFFIVFNYTCLRNVKDTLVINMIGAEAIPFLKLYFVLPSAILFMLLYFKASNLVNNEQLFYITLTPFIAFFGLFAFVLFPLGEIIHPSAETIKNWQAIAPGFLFWPIAIIGKWSYATFYILSELWGSTILSLSFWQFANQTTQMAEAKRFYSLFSFIGQGAMLCTGLTGYFFSTLEQRYTMSQDLAWSVSLKCQMSLVVLGGISIMLIYRWIYLNVLTDKRFYDKAELPGVPKGKKKAGLMQSIKSVFTSPYLILIAMLPICYGISTNLIEIVWKKELQLRFADACSLNVFMNKVTFCTGLATLIMLLIGSNIIRRVRWATAAGITPLMMLLGGAFFLATIIFQSHLDPLFHAFGTNAILVATILGGSMVILIKATKYALFDITKEMAYIPLDEEMKVKGKAAVEVVGGRAGKSGGGFVTSTLLMFFREGTRITDVVQYLAAVFLLICGVWLWVVRKLGISVEEKTSANNQQ